MEISETKYRLLSKLFLKESNNMAVAKRLWIKTNLYKRCLPAITLNKKHSLKQFVSKTYTFGKMFLGAAAFEGLKFTFRHC